MKRIQFACLNQTVHFKFSYSIKNDSEGYALAVQCLREECEKYKLALARGRAKYRIIGEETLEDGSILMKVKKQLLAYEVGSYLD